MTLQSSGAISFTNLQSEFGGSHPIKLSEYYKGGGAVPSTVSETVTAASMSGSVYDGRGGGYSTYPAINSSGRLYYSSTWADNGYTGTGDISWTVNKTGLYHFTGSYYIQNATRTATHTWYVNGSQVATYGLTAGNSSSSHSGNFTVNAGQTVRVVVSWPSAGWASCGLSFGGSTSSNNAIDVTVNASVPTSGAINLADFYSSRAS